MYKQSLHSNCSEAECFPEKSSWCWNEQVCQWYTALYKNIPFLTPVELLFQFFYEGPSIRSKEQ